MTKYKGNAKGPQKSPYSSPDPPILKKKYVPNQTEIFSNVILLLNKPLETTLVLCSLSLCFDILIKI